MSPYEKYKIEYVHMLIFLFVFAAVNCKSNKYNQPQQNLLNGDDAAYHQHERIDNTLLEHGHKIVQKMKFMQKLFHSGTLKPQASTEVNNEPVLTNKLWDKQKETNKTISEKGLCNCTKVVVDGSLSPQLLALTVLLAVAVLCGAFSLLVLMHTYRAGRCYWQRGRCAWNQPNTAAEPYDKQLKVGDLKLSSKPTEMKMGDPVAAGDNRSANIKDYEAFLMSSPTPSSPSPSPWSSTANLAQETRSEGQEGIQENRTVDRLPVSFHYRPQFCIRPHSPAV